MEFRDLVLRNRSTRRFKQDEMVDRSTLLGLVDLARQAPSAMNLQPLKYYLSWKPEQNRKIFPLVKWAGYLEDWSGPGEGEKPAAYIVILGDRLISKSCAKDVGIAAQTILLAAVEQGLKGCMLGSFKDAEVRKVLGFPNHLETQLILALGIPAEESRLEQRENNGSMRYWRDKDEVLHVPKRTLEEILIS